jgi:hypothetical protein
MIGMNAEMIQNAFTALVQLLAQSTATLNELVGCESDRSSGPLSKFKISPTGQLIAKTEDEIRVEKEYAAKRRKTARWILSLLLCVFVYRKFFTKKVKLAIRQNIPSMASQHSSLPPPSFVEEFAVKVKDSMLPSNRR